MEDCYWPAKKSNGKWEVTTYHSVISRSGIWAMVSQGVNVSNLKLLKVRYKGCNVQIYRNDLSLFFRNNYIILEHSSVFILIFKNNFHYEDFSTQSWNANNIKNSNIHITQLQQLPTLCHCCFISFIFLKSFLDCWSTSQWSFYL